jgi:hypothetical protein
VQSFKKRLQIRPLAIFLFRIPHSDFRILINGKALIGLFGL